MFFDEAMLSLLVQITYWPTTIMKRPKSNKKMVKM